MKIALGILASGRGSNLQAILDAIGDNSLDGEVKVVISNKASAVALERARNQNIPAIFLDPKLYVQSENPREAYDQAIATLLDKHGVEAVVLAGYMRIVTPYLIKQFSGKIFNIHPSLLPAFPGLEAQKQALVWGAKISGCSVHFVTEGVDEGPVILQAGVPVLENDTVETLSARILEQEHRIYPQALQLFSQGLLQVEGRRIKILSESRKSKEKI